MAAVNHLSALQLEGLSQRLADPEQGGFSARAFGPNAGEAPPGGSYMVGLPGHGQNDLPMPVSGQQIGAFATSRTGVLQPQDRYLGGWSTGPTASLDVSKAFSSSQGHEAMNLGIAGGEEAIGMIGQKGDYVADIPVVDPRKLLASVNGMTRNRLDPRLGTSSRPGFGSGPGPRSGRARLEASDGRP